MGALMVVDPPHTVRYHRPGSIKTEEHRKNRGWLERETEKNRKEKRHKEIRETLKCFLELPYQKRAFPHQYEETDRERVERV
jgi:hypothetical protein